MFSFLFFKKVITGFEDLHVLNEEAVFFLPFIYFFFDCFFGVVDQLKCQKPYFCLDCRTFSPTQTSDLLQTCLNLCRT